MMSCPITSFPIPYKGQWSTNVIISPNKPALSYQSFVNQKPLTLKPLTTSPLQPFSPGMPAGPGGPASPWNCRVTFGPNSTRIYTLGPTSPVAPWRPYYKHDVLINWKLYGIKNYTTISPFSPFSPLLPFSPYVCVYVHKRTFDVLHKVPVALRLLYHPWFHWVPANQPRNCNAYFS